MKTLLLDRTTWDLCKDASGNIALADEPYAVAQDVACAARLFSGELWYDTTKGVRYFQDILGQFPPFALIKADLAAAALTVPDVASAVCYISGIVGRALTGQLQVKTTSGQVLIAPLSGGNLFILGSSTLGGGDVV